MAAIDSPTLRQVATLLRVGEWTACDRCDAAQLTVNAKVGGRWRVDRAALESWLRRGGDAPSKARERPEERA